MVKLDRLINILGRYGTRLHGRIAARDSELHSVTVHDPIRPHAAVGDVFLAVGIADLREAVTLATLGRAMLAVTRTTEQPSRTLIGELEKSGTALLLVDPAVSWSQIASVVYGLVLEGRETESGRGPSDLFALADTIAATLDAPVTIEDQLCRVMAYSSTSHDTDPVRLDTILGRRMPDHVRALLEEQGIFDHLARTDTPIHVPPAPEHGLRGRTVAAVRTGRELLGSLWISSEEPLSPAQSRILEDGARTVALHLLRSRVSADLERQVESELVIQLLEESPDAEAVAGKLGIPAENLRVVALQAHTELERHAGILLAFERATTGFGWSRVGRSTLFGNTVYTLLPTGDDPAPAYRWVHELVAGLPAHIEIFAGIGGPANLREVAASRHEADECLALHMSSADPVPVCYDTAWDRVLIQRLKSVASKGRLPARDPVAQLADYDARHDTHYLPTLKSWLESHGELSAAARMLDVHPNTVRNRINQMRRIVPLHLNDPSQRVAMLIALSVRSPGVPGE
ncbi:PucR family transcriptional regulator [Nocardia blacklockiae]|uniref:PucR family transcriptional regulator n=1 Tax=Nocardia blacklockiae TaxID=480036 RepID=UPI00189488CD|nr:helix-turn-helix domain-containing protein [Nocardia blacklockiae]MBF6171990.1 helix-turn-helix domain-containing protein [Nocardia blacklockiae]